MRVTWNDTNELNKLYESDKKNVSIPLNQTEFLFVTGVFQLLRLSKYVSFERKFNQHSIFPNDYRKTHCLFI